MDYNIDLKIDIEYGIHIEEYIGFEINIGLHIEFNMNFCRNYEVFNCQLLSTSCARLGSLEV